MKTKLNLGSLKTLLPVLIPLVLAGLLLGSFTLIDREVVPNDELQNCVKKITYDQKQTTYFTVPSKDDLSKLSGFDLMESQRKTIEDHVETCWMDNTSFSISVQHISNNQPLEPWMNKRPAKTLINNLGVQQLDKSGRVISSSTVNPKSINITKELLAIANTSSPFSITSEHNGLSSEAIDELEALGYDVEERGNLSTIKKGNYGTIIDYESKSIEKQLYEEGKLKHSIKTNYKVIDQKLMPKSKIEKAINISPTSGVCITRIDITEYSNYTILDKNTTSIRR